MRQGYARTYPFPPNTAHAGLFAALDALTDYPIRDRLGEIVCPTLIVWGAEDKLVPARDADEQALKAAKVPKLVAIVHAETSTGAQSDAAALAKASRNSASRRASTST